VIVGITGHQELAAADWVLAELTRVVPDTPVTEGLTCLARGADQLFAQVLLERSLPYVAVIPCREYESTFDSSDDLANFRRLLDGSNGQVYLPFDHPTERAFDAAGRYVVDHCELLIAVWDGQAAQGRGGTGDIVAYARSFGRSIRRLDPATRRVMET